TLLGVISSRKRRYLVLRVDDTHRTIHGSAARRVQLAHRANLRTARRPRSRRFLRRRWNVEREPERGAPDEVDMENADSEIREVEPDLVPSRDGLGPLDHIGVQNRRPALVHRSDRDRL